jgi:hypothetical protein
VDTYRKRRSEVRRKVRQRQKDERGRLRVYHEGFNVRISGRSCSPPDEYYGAILTDYVGT